jgi:hypothetical protein
MRTDVRGMRAKGGRNPRMQEGKDGRWWQLAQGGVVRWGEPLIFWNTLKLEQTGFAFMLAVG